MHRLGMLMSLSAMSSITSMILEETLKEIDLGLAFPLCSRAELDETFGPGRWHPNPRHVVVQNGQPRLSDDCTASSWNGSVTLHETIACICNLFPSLVVKSVLNRLCRLLSCTVQDPPAWVVPLIALGDMWKGYRQYHAC